MPKGLALSIGLNKVDPNIYNGWDGALDGCENDAKEMNKVAKTRGFEIAKLFSSQAKRAIILGKIQTAADRLKSGDTFLLSYSGHGSYITDLNGEELDRRDETILAYDGELLDDELKLAFMKFAKGVRIISVFDCCHSGTTFSAVGPATEAKEKRAPEDVMQSFRASRWQDYRNIIDEALRAANENRDIVAEMIYFGACGDDQTAYDGWPNGLFTENLLKTLRSPPFKGDYVKFFNAILALSPNDAKPRYKELNVSAVFKASKPFSI